jgi:rubrerythrin
MLDLFGKNKKKEDAIISVISISKITSVQEISEITELSIDEVCTIIEKMIKKSKHYSEYKLFTNAHINKKTNEVVLNEKYAGGSAGISSMISKIIPGVSGADWKCKFCGTISKGKSCTSCGAAKS